MRESKSNFIFLFLISLFLVFSFTSCGIVGFNAKPFQLPGEYYHVVQKGETLASIAKRYGVESIEIALLNGIFEDSELRIGQSIVVSVPIEDKKWWSAWCESEDKPIGVAYSGAKLLWPVNGGQLTSKFGQRWGRKHQGIDIGAPSGTSVFAAHDAKVVYSGDKLSGFGNLVILRQADGLTSVYAHNRRNLVELGDKVKRGEKIAEVGTTGRSTGPHLHFEIRVRDKRGRFIPVDPLPYLLAKK